MNLCISKKKGELDSLQWTKKTKWITFFATFAIKLMRISETMCWIPKKISFILYYLFIVK